MLLFNVCCLMSVSDLNVSICVLDEALFHRVLLLSWTLLFGIYLLLQIYYYTEMDSTDYAFDVKRGSYSLSYILFAVISNELGRCYPLYFVSTPYFSIYVSVYFVFYLF